ncbi:MAG: uL30 family ribosomal protein [Candidatus Aenigmatarchaeota archaeon]|nr:MAG: uL30 family ribosomal protein [Candidatus Aenigmarchaeota archaeon]
MAGDKFAVIMLKGTVKVNREVVDTLKRLRLSSINSCVIVPADDTHRGMLKSIAEYVTWGEVNKETLKRLRSKRGGADSKVFRLSPPSGGLKAVRLNYPRGDVGYRGADINQLLMRMI